MSSKMMTWIKKRYRKRSESFSQYMTSVTQVHASINAKRSRSENVYESHETNYDTCENIYEDVSESVEGCVSLQSHQMMTEIAKPTHRLDENSTERKCHLCLICRRTSHVLADDCCKCVGLVKNRMSDKHNCTPRPSTMNSQNKKRRMNNDINYSENCMELGNFHFQHLSDIASSGFYESFGSEFMSSGDLYSDNSLAFDMDDGYEVVEFKPSLNQKRRYSIGSLHTVLQRVRRTSFRKAEGNGVLTRTITRRSFKVKRSK